MFGSTQSYPRGRRNMILIFRLMGNPNVVLVLEERSIKVYAFSSM